MPVLRCLDVSRPHVPTPLTYFVKDRAKAGQGCHRRSVVAFDDCVVHVPGVGFAIESLPTPLPGA